MYVCVCVWGDIYVYGLNGVSVCVFVCLYVYKCECLDSLGSSSIWL